MKPLISPLDEAEVRAEARRLYRELGAIGLYSVVLQLLVSANIFLDIIFEEKANRGKSL